MQQSIKRTLNTRIGLVILIVNMTIGILFFSLSIGLMENDFQKKIQSQTRHLADAFTQHLWRMDMEAVKHLGDLAITGPDIVGLKIIDENGATIIENGDFQAGSPFYFKGELRYRAKDLVGYFELSFQNTMQGKQKQIFLVSGFSMVTITMVISFLLVSSLLGRHLVLPLENLQQDMMLVADGVFRQSEVSGQKKEIQNIIDIFNRMSLSLKRRTRALKESEERYREIVEGTENLVTEVDDKGQFIFVNEASKKVFGLLPQECIGMAAFDFIHPQDRERTQNAFAGWLKAACSNVTFENRQVSRTGEVRDMLWSIKIYYDSQGGVSSIKSIARDITNWKQAEIKLKKSEAFLAATIASIQDGVSVLDRELTIQRVNPVMEKWYGGQKPLVGQKCYTCYHSAKGPCDPCPSLRSIRSGQTESDIVPGPKGSAIEWMEVFSYPIRDTETGYVTGVVEFVRDISERVSWEKELAGYREHLEDLVENRTMELKEANKALENAMVEAEKANLAKSQFLANMSHEIRTPLNAVTGFSELLSALVEDEKQKSYLSAIKNAGRNLLTLINDILDLSKIEAGRLELHLVPFHLENLLREIRQVFSIQIARKNLGFLIDIDSRVPEVLKADEIRLRQILINVVGNAVKFTDKGYVRIQVRTVSGPSMKSRTDLSICVEDTGMGIAEKDMAHIFDSFRQQTGQDTGRFGGTGLGLSICRRLLEMMNGEIMVQSCQGKGSKFTIIIRDVEISPREIKVLEDNLNHDNIQFEKGRVLVVDDVESNRSLLSELLSKVNLDVVTAENGHEAMVITPEFQPDIILMDLRMPVMDGFEAAGQLKKDAMTKQIPIIAVTAASYSLDDSEIYDRGFDGLISKPVNIDRLFSLFLKYFKRAQIDSPEKIWGHKDASFTLSSRAVSSLSDLIPILEKDFLRSWEKFRQRQPMGKVEAFAGQLRKLGRKFDNAVLIGYGETLEIHVGNFDVNQMRSQLDRFPLILSEFKSIKEKHDE